MKQLTKSEFNKNGTTYKSVTSPASDTDFTQISDIGVKDDTFSYSVDGENFIKLKQEVVYVDDLSTIYQSPTVLPSSADIGTVLATLINGEPPVTLYKYNGVSWVLVDQAKANTLYYSKQQKLIFTYKTSDPYFEPTSYTNTSQLTNGAAFVNAITMASEINSAVESEATLRSVADTALQASITALQNNKQDALSTAQLNAVNSGITSTLVTQITTNQTDIAGKQDKIDSSHKLSADLVDDTLSTNKFVSSAEKNTWNAKQNALTFDNIPTSNSNNPVKSGGVYSALSGKQDALTFDTTPTNGSTNPVTSDGVYDALVLKADKSGAVGSFDLSIDNTTYVVTLQAKDVNGNNLGTAQTIDLPLESVVVSGSYDSATQKVILTLKDGSTIDFSVADLISGLQTEITSTNKLSADLVDDTNTINKFVTASDITNWNSKQNALTFDDTPTNGSNNPVKSSGIYTALAGKQNTLVAGTNITIDQTTNTISATGGITVDSALSTTSENPVQNKVITEAINTAQNTADGAVAKNTEQDLLISALQNGKVDKVTGKQLSTEDFTTAEKNKLAGLSNYDDTQVQADLSSLSSNKADKNNTNQSIIAGSVTAPTGNFDNINTLLSKKLQYFDTNIIKTNLTVTGAKANTTFSMPNEADGIQTLDLDGIAIISVFGQINASSQMNKGADYNLSLNIPAKYMLAVLGKGYTHVMPLAFSLLHRSSTPQNDYTNSNSQGLTNVTYSDKNGLTIKWNFKKWYDESTAKHQLSASFIIF